MTKTLLEHTYENGNRVHVTNRGVTIWDAKDGRWVMDASTIVDDNEISLGNELPKKDTGYWTVFTSLYPVKKKRAKKKRKGLKSRKE